MLGLVRVNSRFQKQKFLTSFFLCCFLFAFAVSVCGSAFARNIKDVPARIMLQDSSPADFTTLSAHPRIFGASEKRSNSLKAFTKWSDMFARFDRALDRKDAQRLIGKLHLQLDQYQSDSIYNMAVQVNGLMNEKPYIVDQKNWGKSDYWATPIEFLKRGGDCEDFAIAKYAALRAMGVPENRLRLAIVQDEIKNIPHAILVVYSEKGPIILDNQIKEVRSSNAIAHYTPIYSINRNAWWLHTVPKEPSPTIVAAAR